MWPFKKKPKLITDIPDALQKMFARRCPDQHTVSQDCVCMSCNRMGTCNVEMQCRKTGCESFIKACSLKADANGRGVSEFGDNIAAIFTRKMLREFGNEKEYSELNKAYREKQKAQEVQDGQKETRVERTPNGDEPPVSM